jgi:hypothetical protein
MVIKTGIENLFKLGGAVMSCKSIVKALLCLCLSSCANLTSDSGNHQMNDPFVGNWQGNGSDSEGNAFTFFARVSHLGYSKYRILTLRDLDKPDEPIHIMEGVLENNNFSYTADEGLYEGGGTLSENLFEGYYKGPVDGSYTMWRIK